MCGGEADVPENNKFALINRYNKLTEALTEKQIAIWGPVTPVCPVKRIMVGGKEAGNDLTYFSIRWNQDMSEVKIKPLVLQIPQNGWFESGWYFSEDGNWLTATVATFYEKINRQLYFSTSTTNTLKVSAHLSLVRKHTT